MINERQADRFEEEEDEAFTPRGKCQEQVEYVSGGGNRVTERKTDGMHRPSQS